MIAVTRARCHPATRAYLERKMAEGKTRKEAVRCLKRHLARRIHRLMLTPQTPSVPIHAAISIPCLT
jgi:transposase